MLTLKQQLKNNNVNVALFAMLFTFVYGFSQTDPYSLSFVDYSKNYLYQASDSSLTLNFFKKIDALRKGELTKVTIVHYGGSHIQAGTWSDKLISNFQAIQNFNGGGIYAFPFKLAKTNGPHYFASYSTGNWKRFRCATLKEMCLNLGMAGIAAVTNDSSNTFGVKLLKNEHHVKFNSLKIYHNFNSSYKVELAPLNTKSTKQEFKSKGYTLYKFENFIDSVNFELVRVDTNQKDFMLYGFSLESSNPGFYYAGFGVNGAASNSYLRCNLFGEQLETLKPDVVIFSLGVNDTQGKDFSKRTFIEHYDSLISAVRAVSPDCAIILTTTSDNYIKRKMPNKKSLSAQEAMFDLVEKHKASVWDMYAVMGGYKSIYKWQKAGLASSDKVHFNNRGYQVVGQLMYDAIYNSYKNNSQIAKEKQ